jgi:hypothetical protein
LEIQFAAERHLRRQPNISRSATFSLRAPVARARGERAPNVFSRRAGARCCNFDKKIFPILLAKV